MIGPQEFNIFKFKEQQENVVFAIEKWCHRFVDNYIDLIAYVYADKQQREDMSKKLFKALCYYFLNNGVNLYGINGPDETGELLMPTMADLKMIECGCEIEGEKIMETMVRIGKYKEIKEEDRFYNH